jgi:Putative amidase domain
MTSARIIDRRLLLTGGIGAALVAVLPIAAVAAAVTASAAPAAASLSRNSGGVVGGDRLEIRGSRLDAVTAVRFGGREATIVNRGSASVSVVVPHAVDYAAGAVPVTLTTAAGAGLEVPHQYRYTLERPVDRQLHYAFRYWNDADTARFGDFDEMGGDCANFVSQTLHARGWSMTHRWHNHDGTATAAWNWAPSLDRWLRRTRGLTRLTRHQRGRVKIGDVAFFDWNANDVPDHTMVVSDVLTRADGTIDLRFVGHDTDFRYRDLDAKIAVKYPGYDVWYYSVGSR